VILRATEVAVALPPKIQKMMALAPTYGVEFVPQTQ
jgi:hypothetical protein